MFGTSVLLIRGAATMGAVAALLLGPVAGCSSDSTSEGAVDPTSTTRAGGDAGTGKANLSAYCDATSAVQLYFNDFPDVEGLPKDEASVVLKEFIFAAEPLLQDLEESLPADVAGPVGTVVQLTRKVKGTGDPEAMASESFAAARAEAHEFDRVSCDWNQADVVATEYTFDGIPAEGPSGLTSLDFANEGDEVHELLIVRRKDGVTDSYDEILEMPEEEAMAKTEVVAQAFAAPGDADHVVADLAPGDYLALCAIPQGMTDLTSPPPDGPPHLAMGMHVEFRVT